MNTNVHPKNLKTVDGHFVNWDCDGVRNELRTYVKETLADLNGVLVIDETGFLKKSTLRPYL